MAQEKKERLGLRRSDGSSVVDEGYKRESEEENKLQLRIIRSAQTKLLKRYEKIRINNSLKLLSGTDYLLTHSRFRQLASLKLSDIPLPPHSPFDTAHWDIPYDEKYGWAAEANLRPTKSKNSAEPQISFWTGPIERLDPGQRALFVEMVTQSYARDLIKTEGLARAYVDKLDPPINGEKTRQRAIDRQKALLDAELLLRFTHAFRPQSYVLALAYATNAQQHKHLIGGIAASAGQTARKFGKRSDQVSSLPTLAALDMTLSPSAQKLHRYTESQFAEVTRLCVVPQQGFLEFEDKEWQRVAKLLMYLIHLAIQHNFPHVIYEIFNTRMALVEMLRALGLPVEIISTDARSSEHLPEMYRSYYAKYPAVPQVLKVEKAKKVARLHIEELQ